MFRDAFVKLNPQEAANMLAEVGKKLDGSAFEASTATIVAHDLPFYPGYRFVDVANYQQAPAKHRYLVYKSGDITVLDWTNEPIYALNSRVPVVLDDRNIFEYVRFFFTYVCGRHGRFLIAENVDDINWRDEPPPAARKAIGKMLTPLEIMSIDRDGTFNLAACLLFKDSLFKTNIHVKPNGLVSLSGEDLVIEDIPVRDDVLGQ